MEVMGAWNPHDFARPLTFDWAWELVADTVRNARDMTIGGVEVRRWVFRRRADGARARVEFQRFKEPLTSSKGPPFDWVVRVAWEPDTDVSGEVPVPAARYYRWLRQDNLIAEHERAGDVVEFIRAALHAATVPPEVAVGTTWWGQERNEVVE